jgi:putative acetyltransferase
MSKLTLHRTNSKNLHFKELVVELDRYLAIADGKDHAFYNQFNRIEKLQHVIIAYYNKLPVGCGAFKSFDGEHIEIKRMFVTPELRGKKVGSAILKALEQWATEEGYTYAMLETGARMKDAVALYTRNGYTLIPNYPPYESMENSRCFRKKLLL